MVVACTMTAACEAEWAEPVLPVQGHRVCLFEYCLHLSLVDGELAGHVGDSPFQLR